MTRQEFWAKVQKIEGDHWIFQGSMTAPHLGGQRGARRIAWLLMFGKPGGANGGQIENDCGTHKCINPKHQHVMRFKAPDVRRVKRAAVEKRVIKLSKTGLTAREISEKTFLPYRRVARIIKVNQDAIQEAIQGKEKS